MHVARLKPLLHLYTVCLLALLFMCASTPGRAQCPTVTIPAPVCAGGNCGAGTPITVGGDTVGVTRYEWIISRQGNQPDTVRGKDPVYSFADAGQYQVTLRITRNGVATSCPPQSVNVQGFGEFTIGPDNNLGPPEEEICKGTSITLSPAFQSGGAPPNATYLWSGGQTTPTITTDSAGCYSVTITDPATGCSRSARVNVTVYKPDPNTPPPPREESRWYFGSGSGIRFVGGQPEAITGNANTPEGTSSISDANGTFLFYTDGRNVYDKTGAPMRDRAGNPVLLPANGLNGGPNATQSVLIIAQPGCNDCEPIYYVFTTTDIGAGGSRLEYSVVDMRLNNGLGQVTQKNVPLFETSTERVAAIRALPDSNNTTRPETTWIVTHDFNSNTFRVYPLTGRGVGSPKTYAVGQSHGPSTANGEGYLKVYANRVVVVIPGAPGEENIVQVFKFDAATGVVSGPPNTIRLGVAPPKAYGVEIVRDSTLYVSLSGSGADSSKVLGFSLVSGVDSTIQKSRRQVFATTEFSIGALQLDPNGQRLFVAQQGQNSLGEITNPNNLAAAGYNRAGVPLTAPSQLGLPSSVPPNNRNTGQGFTFSTPVCTPENTPATISFRAQPDRAGGQPQFSAYEWSFQNGNPATLARAGFGVNDSVSVVFPGPGTYTATLTIFNDCTDLNAPGGARPETFTQQVVIPLQPPRPTIRDTSGCAGSRIVLDPYRGRPAPAGVQYAWITPARDTLVGPNTLEAVLPGLYTIFVFNDQCQVSANVRVNYNTLTVNLGEDTTLCRNTTLNLNAGNPGATYEWYNPSNQLITREQILTVTPTASTYYRVKVTGPAPARCVEEDTIIITVSSRPRITATVQPATSCDPNSAPGTFGAITLNTTDAAAATYQYRWLREGMEIPGLPPDISSLSALLPGIYQVIVLKPGGCDTTLTLSVQNQAPDAVAFSGTPPVLGCSETTGRLELTRTDGTPGNRQPIAYRLLTAGGQPVAGASGTNNTDNTLIISGLAPGVYRLEGTYGSNCTFAFVYEVQPPPNKPDVQASFAITGCREARLSVTGQVNTANTSYVWQLQGGSPLTNLPDNRSATATESGNYILTATSTVPPGCVTLDTVTINFPRAARITVKPASPACQGSEIRLEANVISDFDTYSWKRPDGSLFNGAELIATQPGTYWLRASNSQTSCNDSVAVTPLFVPVPPAPAITAPPPICAGGLIPTLVATGQNFRWYGDANRTVFISDSPGFRPPLDSRVPATVTYYVTQSTAEGCESPATPVTVNIIPAPVAALGPDLDACEGSPLALNATVAIPGATYRWNTGQNTPVIDIIRAGTYIVQVSAGTCTVSDTVVVTFRKAPVVNIQRREVPLCLSDGVATATLDAGPGEGYSYEWREAGSLAVLGNDRRQTVTDVGLYTVTVRNSGICPATDTVRVVDKCEPRVLVPDAFTPNNDGTNDDLKVVHAYVGDFRLLIFNRWGEVIFSSDAPETRWDGTYLGQKVPPGTYTWKIVYTAQFYRERPPVEVRGGVLLLR